MVDLSIVTLVYQAGYVNLGVSTIFGHTHIIFWLYLPLIAHDISKN